MSYTPDYMEFLDSPGQTGITGWPKRVDKAGMEFATAKAIECINTRGMAGLADIRSHIYQNRAEIPESILSPLQDFTYAVAYRAALAANSRQVFISPESYLGDKKKEHWMMIKVSRKDVEILKQTAWGLSSTIKKVFAKIVSQLAVYPVCSKDQREKLVDSVL